jgi:hypothetical protein
MQHYHALVATTIGKFFIHNKESGIRRSLYKAILIIASADIYSSTSNNG